MDQVRASSWLGWSSAILCIAGGFLLALGAHPSTAWAAELFVDLCFWPLDGAQNLAAPEARLFAGIGGGAFVGLGVMIWRNARELRMGHMPARATILAGIMGWFLTDSTFSVLAGAPMNAVYNLVLLGVFLVPYVMGAKDRAIAQ